MEQDEQEINVDLPDNHGKPVVINAENGSVVTVNVNVRNYYGPEWFDRSAFDGLLEAIKGRG
jgi:hypothetical protein